MTTLRAVRHRDDDYWSFFDPITGLPKRSLLRDRLIMSLSRARRDNLYVGLISVRFVRPAAQQPGHRHCRCATSPSA